MSALKQPGAAALGAGVTVSKGAAVTTLLSFESGSFTRESAATRTELNLDGTMYLEMVAPGVIRTQRRPGETGIPEGSLYLFEGETENIARRTTEFDQYTCSQGATCLADTHDGPMRGSNAAGADTVRFNAADDETYPSTWAAKAVLSSNGSITTGMPVMTSSLFCYSGMFRFYQNTTPNTWSQLLSANGAWERFDFTTPGYYYTAVARPESDAVLPLDTVVWGLQIERLPFPTSYVHRPFEVSGSQAWRRADSLTFPSAPAVMRSGRWSFDAYPLFGTSDGSAAKPGTPELGINNQTFKLFSFGGADGIAFKFANGVSQVEVTRGGTPADTNVTWDRHERVRFVVDGASGQLHVLVGQDAPINITMPGTAFSAGTLRVGAQHDAGSGGWVAGTEAFARISQPVNAMTPCAITTDCGVGEVCGGEIGQDNGANNGWHYGLSGTKVCWPAQCVTANGSLFTGTVASVCGVECTIDVHCASGQECGVNEGPRLGEAVGTNVCWPAGCNEAVDRTRCGSLESECGYCPTTPIESEPLVDFEADDSNRTFRRGSFATRQDLDYEGKLIVESVGIDEIRTERRASDPSGTPTLYLFEGARMNYLRHATQFDAATYAKPHLRTTTDPDGVVAESQPSPDATRSQSADTILLSGATNGSAVISSCFVGSYPPYNVQSSTNVPLVYSAYHLAGTARFHMPAGMQPNFPPAWPPATVNRWSRVDALGIASASPGSNVAFRINTPFPNQDSDVTVWGGQVEVGEFPSSLIHTTSVALGREADVLEFATVPEVIREGQWRFEVYPAYGSDDAYRLAARPAGLRSRTFGLFSFVGGDGVSLYFDNLGRSYVRVSLNGEILLIPHWWERHERIAIGVDTTSPTPRASVDGVWHGFDALTGVSASFPDTTMLVGSAYDGTQFDPGTSAFARISEPRPLAELCDAQGQCAPGFTCGADNGASYGLSATTDVCWPSALCDEPLRRAQHCGSVDDPCGLCCASDAECDAGEHCGDSNGEQFGLSAGTNVCWPAECEAQVIPAGMCGDEESPCGLCPAAAAEGFIQYRDGVFNRPGTDWWSATSTHVDANGGLVVRNWKHNELRSERRPIDPPGAATPYLFEGATNVYTRLSDDMENTYWSRESLVPASDGDGIRNNAATAPDGTGMADVIQLSANAASRAGLQVFPPFNPEVNWTASVFHHSGAGILRLPRMNSLNYSDVSLVPSAQPKWQRFDVRHRSGTAGAYPRVYLQNTQTNPTAHDLTAWGIQVEVGNFPTSFVRTVNPTNFSLLVRNADVLTFDTVPTEMAQPWSVDVYPLHGSSDGASAANTLGISNTTYGLFAYGGSGTTAITDQYIALYYDAAGASHLRVVQGANVADIPVTWSRHERLVLTVDVPGHRVALGDVSRTLPWLQAFPQGRMMVGGLFASDGTQAPNSSAFSRLSEPRAYAHTTCDDDSDCRQGEVCGDDNGDNYGLGAERVCWPAACESDFGNRCGGVNSECGTCCSSSSDCAAGEACGIGAGVRKGLGEGVNLCWPAHCSVYDPRRVTDCGTTSDPCGLCPVCTPACAGKQCGDDGCGGSCGAVPNEETHYCSPDGLVAVRKGRYNRPLGDAPAPGADPDDPLVPVALAESSTSSSGYMAGSLGVTSTGVAKYSVPIQVPPGRAGFQPHLAIGYDSTRANGALGPGWSLEGFSAVTRCRRSTANGGTNRPIAYDNTDGFCLDGALLVPVLGWNHNGHHLTEYRTELESFRKVISYADDDDSGPMRFRVWSKDGTISTFGERHDAVLRHRQPTDVEPGVIRTWALSSVDDVRGSYMSIYYGGVTGSGQTHVFVVAGGYHPDNSDGSTVELVPVTVAYGGWRDNPDAIVEASNGHDRSVNLRYDSDRNEDLTPVRPDALYGWTDGQPEARAQLLVGVDARVGGFAVGAYALRYEVDGRGLSMLRSIEQCAPRMRTRATPHANPRQNPDGWTCLPPTAVTYHPSSGPKFLPAIPMAGLRFREGAANGGVFVAADIDGDGRDEIVGGFAQDVLVNEQWETMLEMRVQMYDEEEASFVPVASGITIDHLDLAYGKVVAEDWDFDGDDDIIVSRWGGWFIYLSNGASASPVFDAEPYSIVDHYNHQNEHMQLMADVNHDGVADLANCVDGVGHVYLRNPEDPFQLTTSVVESCDFGAAGDVDLDEDGTVDLSLTDELSVDLTGDGTLDRLATSRQAYGGGCEGGPNSYCWEGGFRRYFGVAVGKGDGTYGSERVHTHLEPDPCHTPETCTAYYATYDAYEARFGLDPRLTSLLLDYDNDYRTDVVIPPVLLDSPWIILSARKPDLEDDGLVAFTTKEDDAMAGSTAGVPTLLADVNGDGVVDIVNPGANVVYLRAPTGASAGRLATVSTGHHEYLVSYGMHAHAAEARCSYPTRCLGQPPHVPVASVRETFGPTDHAWYQTKSRVTTYRYSGARSDRIRGAFLGFAGREVAASNTHGSLVERVRTVRETYAVDLYDSDHKLHYGAGRLQSREIITPVERVTDAESVLGVRRSQEAFLIELRESEAGRPYAIEAGSTKWEFESPDAAVDPYGTLVSASGSAASEPDGFGNPTGRITVLVNAQQEVVASTTEAMTYWPANEEQWFVSQLRQSSVTDEYLGAIETRSVNFEYAQSGGTSPEGLLSKVIRAEGDSEYEQTTTYTRDRRGNVESIVTQGGDDTSRVEWSYDDRGMFPTSASQTSDAVSLVTQFRISDAHGGELIRVNPDGTASARSYDGFGRLRRDISLDRGWNPTRGAETEFGNAPVLAFPVPTLPALRITRRVGGVQPDGTVDSELGGALLDLDGRGQIVRQEVTGFGGVGVVTEHQRDFDGRIVMQTVPHLGEDFSRGWTEQRYDHLGRVVERTDALGHTTRFEYGSVNAIISPPPDGAWTTKVVDAEGVTRAALYSARGYPLWSVTATGKTEHRYRAFGNRALTIDANNNERSLAWGSYGRLDSVSDPDSGTTSYEYDGLGRVRLVTDSAQGEVEYEYDDLGRVAFVWERPSVSDPSRNAETSMVWDIGAPQNIGKLVEVSRTQGGTGVYRTKGYDASTAIAESELLSFVGGSLNGSALMTFGHDVYGRVNELGYPNAVGASGSTSSGNVSVAFDYEHGSLVAVRPAHDREAEPYWQWTAADHGYLVKEQRFGNGTRTEAQYVRTDAIQRLQTFGPTGSVLQDLTYSYYGNGTVESVLNPLGNDRRYLYDDVNRLEYVLDGIGRVVEHFAYDAIGNITDRSETAYDSLGNATEQAWEYGYIPHQAGDVAGVPHGVRSFGANEYRYDGVGNQVERRGPDVAGGVQSLTYNMFGLPETIATGEGAAIDDVAYTYDGMGARVARTDARGSSMYMGDLYRRTTPVDPTAPIEHRFGIVAQGRTVAEIVQFEERDPGGGAPVLTDAGTSYFHVDRLGTPETVTSETGSARHLAFNAFGMPQGDYWSDGDRRGFTGHSHEPELGLINMRGRFFDPLLGRFLSPDPAPGGLDGEGNNRYSYVLNNPVNGIDPTGYQCDFSCPDEQYPPFPGDPDGGEGGQEPLDPGDLDQLCKDQFGNIYEYDGMGGCVQMQPTPTPTPTPQPPPNRPDIRKRPEPSYSTVGSARLVEAAAGPSDGGFRANLGEFATGLSLGVGTGYVAAWAAASFAGTALGVAVLPYVTMALPYVTLAGVGYVGYQAFVHSDQVLAFAERLWDLDFTSNDYFVAGSLFGGGLGVAARGAALKLSSRMLGVGGAEASGKLIGPISREELAGHLVGRGFSQEAAASFASSFEGKITARMTQAGEQFFRYTGQAGTKGSFLSSTAFASPSEAASALNLSPWGNPAGVRQLVLVNSPSLVFEGGIAGGAQGITQTLLVDRSAFTFGLGVVF